MKRVLTAGAAVALVVAGAAACTSGDGDTSAGACKGGTYAWSDVRKKPTLTGLAKPVTFKKARSHYTASITPLPGARHKVTFTSEETGPRAKSALESLRRHIKSEGKLASLGEEIGDSGVGHESADGGLVGAYYAWSSADLVEADFSYRCEGAEPVRGHVLTWSVEGTGFLPCADRQEDDDVDDVARKAALERCPEGSPAAKEPKTT
ncbi:hypothetical protein ACQB60_37695 [Actinomycetota bacterium Odt1-20B]